MIPLSLNEDKTEFLIIGTKRQLPKVSVVKIKVDQAVETPVSSVSSLGAWFDSYEVVKSATAPSRFETIADNSKVTGHKVGAKLS